ncbi:MAG: glycosyltransferase family 2 protein [Candidatus Omnitrophica bacterium]|nr:glycosyltransferase family 2 protein [Candidatus Omnitrophota bacterium]
MNPAVSVILPTHNRAELLMEAVESVRTQTFASWELLIVDDGSADGTAEAVRAACAADPRIRSIRQANQGVAAARNAGIAASRGELIAFLDDDDRWLPRKLEAQTAFMQAHAALGFSYTRYQFVGGLSGRVRIDPPRLLTTFEELLSVNCINTSTVMVRRDALDTVGGFKAVYQLNEDYHLWLRIAQQFPIGALGDPLAVYTHRSAVRRLTQDRMVLALTGIHALADLRLEGRCRKVRRAHIAKIHYELGRTCWNAEAYWRAAKHFTLALCTHPLARVLARKRNERGLGLALHVLKGYLSVPWCLVKGALHAGR